MEVCVLCISPLAINERNKTERMTKRSEKESSERKRGKRAKTTRQNVKGNVRTTLGMKTEKAFTRQQKHPEAEGRSRLIQYDIRHGNPSLACSHPCRAMREQSSNELKKKKKALPTDKKKKKSSLSCILKCTRVSVRLNLWVFPSMRKMFIGQYYNQMLKLDFDDKARRKN